MSGKKRRSLLSGKATPPPVPARKATTGGPADPTDAPVPGGLATPENTVPRQGFPTIAPPPDDEQTLPRGDPSFRPDPVAQEGPTTLPSMDVPPSAPTAQRPIAVGALGVLLVALLATGLLVVVLVGGWLARGTRDGLTPDDGGSELADAVTGRPIDGGAVPAADGDPAPSPEDAASAPEGGDTDAPGDHATKAGGSKEKFKLFPKRAR